MEEIIIKKLVATGKWSESAARRGLRSRFKCEYCDRDLLASVNDYKEWQEDHIIPISAGGEDTDDNIVISCRTCNVNVKSKWDPRTVCGQNASREELILAVREYIAERRERFLSDINQFREIVYGN